MERTVIPKLCALDFGEAQGEHYSKQRKSRPKAAFY
jgi:hypothetical protein